MVKVVRVARFRHAAVVGGEGLCDALLIPSRILLADGSGYAAQQLWLRNVRNHTEAPPQAGDGASAPKAAQQDAGPARRDPSRAQAVPKPETAAQLARRERSTARARCMRIRACGRVDYS